MKKIKRLLTKEHHRAVMELEWIADLLSKREFQNKHVGNGTDLEDLKQVAFWGICAAVYDWRPDGGKAIHSYAWDRANAYIGHYMRDKSRIIKIPRNIQKTYYNYVELKKNPDIKLPDILFKLDVTKEQLEEAKGVSLSTPFQLYSETLNPEIEQLTNIEPSSSSKVNALTIIAEHLSDSEMKICLDYFDGKLKKMQDKELAEKLIAQVREFLDEEEITIEVLDE